MSTYKKQLSKNEPSELANPACYRGYHWRAGFHPEPTIHAIPNWKHDPRASGWIAVCGMPCTGGREEEGEDSLPKCVRCEALLSDNARDETRNEA